MQMAFCYVSIKEGCFVCVMLSSLKSHALTPCALDTIGKPKLSKGALRWFLNV